jgi:uncharacterized protein YoxC
MWAIFLISLVYLIGVWILAIVIWKSSQKIASAFEEIKNVISTSFINTGENTSQRHEIKKQSNNYENDLEESLNRMNEKVFERSVDVSDVHSQESSSRDNVGDIAKELKGMQE